MTYAINYKKRFFEGNLKGLVVNATRTVSGPESLTRVRNWLTSATPKYDATTGDRFGIESFEIDAKGGV